MHDGCDAHLNIVNNSFDIVLTPSIGQVSGEPETILTRTVYDPCLHSAITKDNVADGALQIFPNVARDEELSNSIVFLERGNVKNNICYAIKSLSSATCFGSVISIGVTT